MYLLLIILTLLGCSNSGAQGLSKIIFIHDGGDSAASFLEGVNYNYDLLILNSDSVLYNWDNQFDINLSVDTTHECFTDAPSQIIEPATYHYVLTIFKSDNPNIDGYIPPDTLIYCSSFPSDSLGCPEEGIKRESDSAFVVIPNLPGSEPTSLFKDGEAGLDIYYLFNIKYNGDLDINLGCTDENCANWIPNSGLLQPCN